MALTEQNIKEISKNISIYRANYLNEIGNLRNHFYNNTNVQIETFRLYVKLRTKVKEHMYSGNVNNGRMDRHKISALLLISILFSKPIKAKHPEKDGMKELEKIANATIGYQVALETIQNFYETENVGEELNICLPDKYTIEEMIKLLFGNHNLLFSFANISKRIKSKQYDDQFFFFLSTIFFFIEEYSVLHKKYIKG